MFGTHSLVAFSPSLAQLTSDLMRFYDVFVSALVRCLIVLCRQLICARMPTRLWGRASTEGEMADFLLPPSLRFIVSLVCTGCDGSRSQQKSYS